MNVETEKTKAFANIEMPLGIFFGRNCIRMKNLIIGLALVAVGLSEAKSQMLQTLENSFTGDIQLSGSCCNYSNQNQVVFYAPVAQPPTVSITVESSGTFNVIVRNVGGITGSNRWFNEVSGGISGLVLSAGSTSNHLLGVSELRGRITTAGTYFLPESHSMPPLIWRVDLERNGVVLDSAYVNFSVSGNVTAILHNGNPFSGPTSYYLNNTPVNANISLQENPNILTVKFSVKGESGGPPARLELLVGEDMVWTSMVSRGGEERFFSITASPRKGTSVVNAEVRLLVDGREVRRARTPNVFENHQYELNFGRIDLGCQPCASCRPGEMRAGLSSK